MSLYVIINLHVPLFFLPSTPSPVYILNSCIWCCWSVGPTFIVCLPASAVYVAFSPLMNVVTRRQHWIIHLHRQKSEGGYPWCHAGGLSVHLRQAIFYGLTHGEWDKMPNTTWASRSSDPIFLSRHWPRHRILTRIFQWRITYSIVFFNFLNRSASVLELLNPISKKLR